MSVMLTADDLAARTDRAVAAAAASGCDVGLTVAEPRVLYDVFSVVVHLAPAPVVVVRVPTVLRGRTAQLGSVPRLREAQVVGTRHRGGTPLHPQAQLAEPVRHLSGSGVAIPR